MAGQLFVPRLIDRYRRLQGSRRVGRAARGRFRLAGVRRLDGRLSRRGGGLDGRFDAGHPAERGDQRGAGSAGAAGPLPVGHLPGLPGRRVPRADLRRDQPATSRSRGTGWSAPRSGCWPQVGTCWPVRPGSDRSSPGTPGGPACRAWSAAESNGPGQRPNVSCRRRRATLTPVSAARSHRRSSGGSPSPNGSAPPVSPAPASDARI